MFTDVIRLFDSVVCEGIAVPSYSILDEAPLPMWRTMTSTAFLEAPQRVCLVFWLHFHWTYHDYVHCYAYSSCLQRRTSCSFTVLSLALHTVAMCTVSLCTVVILSSMLHSVAVRADLLISAFSACILFYSLRAFALGFLALRLLPFLLHCRILRTFVLCSSYRRSVTYFRTDLSYITFFVLCSPMSVLLHCILFQFVVCHVLWVCVCRIYRH